MSDPRYRYVREERPDLYRRVAGIGWALSGMHPDADRMTIAARGEEMAMEIVSDMLGYERDTRCK